MLLCDVSVTMSTPGRSDGEAATPKAEQVTKSALKTVGNQILPFVIGGGSGVVATTCLQPVVSFDIWLRNGEGSAQPCRSNEF